jgi:hypothetical protein
VGVPLVLFGTVLHFLPKLLSPLVLLVAFAAFSSSNISINEKKNKIADSVNPVIGDFQKIKEKLKPGSTIYYPEGYRNLIRGAPYAVGYLLSDHYVVDKKRDYAQYIISKKRFYNSKGLTVRNRNVFLFSNKKAPRKIRPNSSGPVLSKSK